MHISWLGLFAFKLETPGVTIVTDPYAPGVALRPLRAKADVVTISQRENPAQNHVAAILGEPFVIDSPGEFEVKGVYAQGMSLGNRESGMGNREKTTSGQRRAPTPDARRPMPSAVFTFDVDGLRLAHLGGAAEPPSTGVLERLGDVDVLFLPVGGGDSLAPEAATTVVNAIEPRVVIPMYFAIMGLKLPEKLLPASAFLREMGASRVEPVERFSIKKRDLSGEETKVVLLAA